MNFVWWFSKSCVFILPIIVWRINVCSLFCRGQTPADAEFNFLDHAKRLDMYGVVLYRAKASVNYNLEAMETEVEINRLRFKFQIVAYTGLYLTAVFFFQDSNGKEIQLGVTSLGIVVFQNSIRINSFSWSKIVKLSFKRKQFLVQLRREPVSKYK